MKLKRVDGKDLRKRVNLKTCLSEGMGWTTRIAVVMQGGMRGGNESLKEEQKEGQKRRIAPSPLPIKLPVERTSLAG
jgi:hypothetical protein